MTEALIAADELLLDPVLAAWPTGAFLLDGDGTVLAHSAGEPALRGWIPADARGLDFFLDVVPCGEVPELGGAFHMAMADDESGLDVDVDWRFGTEERSLDVRVRLRKLRLRGQALALALVEDNTRCKTAERALAAALGEAREVTSRDPLTGLFARRHYDFAAPIELRRAHRYGFATALLGLAVSDASAGGGQGSLTDDQLRAVAATLAAALRQTDLGFRFAPGVFHVLLTHSDAAGAAIASRRLCGVLQGLQLPGLPRLLVRSAVSSRAPVAGTMQYVTEAQAMLAEVAAGLAQR